MYYWREKKQTEDFFIVCHPSAVDWILIYGCFIQNECELAVDFKIGVGLKWTKRLEKSDVFHQKLKSN